MIATTRFQTVGDVDRFVMQVRAEQDVWKRSANEELIASNYLTLGQLAKAEHHYKEHIKLNPNNDNAKKKLADILEVDSRYGEALPLRRLLANGHRKSLDDTLQLARTYVKLATQSLNSASCAENVLLAVVESENTRTLSRGNMLSDDAINIMVSALEIFDNNCDTIEPSFIETILKVSAYEETFVSPRLHVMFLKSLLIDPRNPSGVKAAWSYVVSKQRTFIYDFEWNTHVKQHFSFFRERIEDPGDGSENVHCLEVELAIQRALAVLFISKKSESSSTSKLLADLATCIHESDWVFPLTDEVARKWSALRQEYVSQEQYLKGWSGIQSIINVGGTSLEETSQLRHTLQLCLNHLFISLGHRPKLSIQERNVHELCSERLSHTSHLVLTILRCFNTDWLYEKDAKLRPQNPFRTEVGSSTASIFELPSLGLLGKETLFPKNMQESCNWMGKQRGLPKADEIGLICDPWDLKRVVTVAGWHLLNGTVRTWLRKLFPRLQERIKYESVGKSLLNHNTSTPRKFVSHRPSTIDEITYADLEIFLLILLIERHISTQVRHQPATMGQLTYLAEVAWNPSKSQTMFWRTCLHWQAEPQSPLRPSETLNYPQRHYFSRQLLTSEQISQALAEIRGQVISSPLPYSERGTLSHSGTRPASVIDVRSSHRKRLFGLIGMQLYTMSKVYSVDRSAESRYYLDLALSDSWTTRLNEPSLYDEKPPIVISDMPVSDEGDSDFGASSEKLKEMLESFNAPARVESGANEQDSKKDEPLGPITTSIKNEEFSPTPDMLPPSVTLMSLNDDGYARAEERKENVQRAPSSPVAESPLGRRRRQLDLLSNYRSNKLDRSMDTSDDAEPRITPLKARSLRPVDPSQILGSQAQSDNDELSQTSSSSSWVTSPFRQSVNATNQEPAAAKPKDEVSKPALIEQPVTPKRKEAPKPFSPNVRLAMIQQRENRELGYSPNSRDELRRRKLVKNNPFIAKLQTQKSNEGLQSKSRFASSLGYGGDREEDDPNVGVGGAGIFVESMHSRIKRQLAELDHNK